MSSIQPLADQIVAEALEAEDKTTSGIYLPEQAKEKPQTAKVLAVGKDVKELKKNDTIVYKSFSTTEVKLEGKEYLIIKEEDVLGIVK